MTEIYDYLDSRITHHAPETFDRESSIGGTDIGGICGHNKYLSSYRVWQNKRGQGDPIEDNALMEWGRRNEDAVIKKLCDNHPRWSEPFRPGKDYPGVMHLPDSKIHASPDGFAMTPDGLVLLEAKTASYFSRNMWGESGSDIYPLHYRYQVQWYLHITGLDKAYIGVLIGGNDYREYTVKRNDDMICTMELTASEFWQNVYNNTPPLPNRPSELGDYLLDTRGEHSENLIKASNEHDNWVTEIKRIDSEIKKLETKKKTLQYQLKSDIKKSGAKGIQHDNWKATWSTSESEKISGWKDYAAELEKGWDDAGLATVRAKHTKVNKSDRLTISHKKGGKK